MLHEARPDPEETARMSRILTFVVVGLTLLAATYAGVKLARGEDPLEALRPKVEPAAPPSVDEGPASIVCWGYVDGLHHWDKLVPQQVGPVVEVVSEYMKAGESYVPRRVKKGDVLLRLDDEMARHKVDEAANALEAARLKQADVEKLAKQRDEKLKQLSYAVAGYQAERRKVEQQREAERLAREGVSPLGKATLAAYTAALEKLDASLQAEESKRRELELEDPRIATRLAAADVKAKENLVSQAKTALEKYTLRAHKDGTILRVNLRVGETFMPTPQGQAPIEFLPDDSRIIVRAEVLQEWASRVQAGKEAVIQDDTFQEREWKGRVRSLSGWLSQARSTVIEPFRQNDVRTLECIVDLDHPNHDLRIGQRMRVKIKI